MLIPTISNQPLFRGLGSPITLFSLEKKLRISVAHCRYIAFANTGPIYLTFQAGMAFFFLPRRTGSTQIGQCLPVQNIYVQFCPSSTLKLLHLAIRKKKFKNVGKSFVLHRHFIPQLLCPYLLFLQKSPKSNNQQSIFCSCVLLFWVMTNI